MAARIRYHGDYKRAVQLCVRPGLLIEIESLVTLSDLGLNFCLIVSVLDPIPEMIELALYKCFQQDCVGHGISLD